MLITVLSPPSRVSVWAMPIIRRLAEASLGPVDYFHLSTAEQFSIDWQNRQSEHVILLADNPDRRLSKILCDSRGLTLFLRDDPLAVVDFLKTTTSQDVRAATRLASTTFATLHDVIMSKPSMITITSDICEDPRRFIERVSSVLNLPIDAKAKDDIAEDTERIDAATSFIDHPEITDAIEPFHSLFQWNPTDRFRWAREVFLGVDRVGIPTNLPPADWIDLTGPARILVYGPYFHLPSGAWGANIRFAVDKNLSGNLLFAEIMSGSKVMVTSTFPLPRTGEFEFTIPFEVTEPRDPIQIRMTILEGALEGVLSLKDVTIFRMDGDRLLP